MHVHIFLEKNNVFVSKSGLSFSAHLLQSTGLYMVHPGDQRVLLKFSEGIPFRRVEIITSLLEVLGYSSFVCNG